MTRATIIRLIAAMALAGTVAACAQRQANLIQQVLELGANELTRDDPQANPLPSRAELDEIPYPMIAISRSDSPATGIVIAVTANADGYATYQDQTRRSVILRGGQVSGTQGFGYDLSAIKGQRNDPVVRRTPVADWPDRLIRNYQFSLQSTPDFQITVVCTLQPVVREQVVIFEIAQDVMRVQEDCRNDTRQFSNTYWADPDTGFIWKSTQWIGPRVTPLTVEVIRPLKAPAGSRG